ncbi:isochorismatase family protein [Micromonospora costi]|uniref:Isochorismatase family protein n=1 Tax=Micromonospora costi TaxID=1530042 RepID=A0A3B0A4Q9_9ACTN|nr:isochorismatase family protein [Micromonospora costi]
MPHHSLASQANHVSRRRRPPHRDRRLRPEYSPGRGNISDPHAGNPIGCGGGGHAPATGHLRRHGRRGTPSCCRSWPTSTRARSWSSTSKTTSAHPGGWTERSGLDQRPAGRRSRGRCGRCGRPAGTACRSSGSWGAELVDELRELVEADDIRVPKYRMNGFHDTHLDQVLRAQGIRARTVSPSPRTSREAADAPASRRVDVGRRPPPAWGYTAVMAGVFLLLTEPC